MNKTTLLKALLLALLVAALTAGCEDDAPIAQGDWILNVEADPATIPVIPAEGAISTITAIVFNESSVPQGGIDVRCSTSLGEWVDGVNQGETQNSTGQVQFDLRLNAEGTAEVTCSSGPASGSIQVSAGSSNQVPSAVMSISTISTPNDADEAIVGESVTFDANRSDDFDGEVVRHRWSFISTNPEIDFNNDGVVEPQEIVEYTPVDPEFAGFTYEFMQEQRLTISLTVFDDLGAQSTSDDRTLLITSNAAPIANAGPPQDGTVADVGGQIQCTATIDACQSRDGDEGAGGEISVYFFNWGDGRNPDAAPTCAFPHTYFPASLPASYTVTLTVYDNGNKEPACGFFDPRNPSSDACPSERATAQDTTTVQCLAE